MRVYTTEGSVASRKRSKNRRMDEAASNILSASATGISSSYFISNHMFSGDDFLKTHKNYRYYGKINRLLCWAPEKKAMQKKLGKVLDIQYQETL